MGQDCSKKGINKQCPVAKCRLPIFYFETGSLVALTGLCVSHHTVLGLYVMLRSKLWPLCLLGKHSTNLASCSALPLLPLPHACLEARVQFRCLSQLPSLSLGFWYFETGCLWTWNSPVPLDCLASELQRFTCLSLSIAGIAGVHHEPGVLCGCLGSRPRSPWHSKQFTSWAISPVPAACCIMFYCM